jgi:hypothetical protein
MKLKKALDDKTFDVRLRDRLTADGKLTKEQVDKYLTSLEDNQNMVKKDENQSVTTH